MLDELPVLEVGEKEIPRWIQVPVGLILGFLTLLCGFASVILLLAPNKKSPVLAIVGLILLLGCLWVLEKCEMAPVNASRRVARISFQWRPRNKNAAHRLALYAIVRFLLGSRAWGVLLSIYEE
jgi:hypothetical protein